MVHTSSEKIPSDPDVIDNIQDSEYCFSMVGYSSLMTRVGLATMELARRLLTFSIGDRIPPIADLAKEMSCGVGTAKAALAILEESHSVKLQSRGHLGTFVTDIDYSELWRLSGERHFTIAMPLPYSRRYEGIATGLQESFRSHDLPVLLTFIRGANARVNALREQRADMALISGLAAPKFENLHTISDLGPETYVSAHGIIKRADADLTSPDLRLGIDPMSADQVTLLTKVFPQVSRESMVESSYTHVVRSLKENLIDATVWNLDEVSHALDSSLEVVPLPVEISDSNTHAVLVSTSPEESIPQGVVDALHDPLIVTKLNDVMSGTTLPTY